MCIYLCFPFYRKEFNTPKHCALVDSWAETKPHFKAIMGMKKDTETECMMVLIRYESLLPPLDEFSIPNAEEELRLWIEGG